MFFYPPAFCDRCQREFGSIQDLERHEANSSRHHICYDHQIDFDSAHGLKEHFVQSRGHDYCQYCDMHLDYDVQQHFYDQHSYCQTCDSVFVNDYGLQEHYRQSRAHNYCFPCGRDFRSPANLQNHLDSSIHTPKNTQCPFCPARFVSQSAMVLHLDQGTCPSGANRQLVNLAVTQLDRNHLITNPNRMIGSSMDFSANPVIATLLSWNGCAFECYLCHREFNHLQGLNQHLSSPMHELKIYKCPNFDCNRPFSSLSAFCQHVEKGSCGVGRFRQVRHVMEQLQTGTRWMSY